MTSLAIQAYQRTAVHRVLTLAAAMFLLVCLFITDIFTGPAMLPLKDVLAILINPGHPADNPLHAIVWSIRLPMTCMAVIVGCSLGIAGAQMQTILDNPLASPYTLGLSAAAGFGAACTILFGISLPWLGAFTIPFVAFICSSCACLGIYAIGRSRGMSSEIMILSGIAMLFLFQSLQSMIQYLAAPEVLQQIVFWLFGSLLKSTWLTVSISGLIILVTAPIIYRDAWKLTAMRLGDERARALGVNTERLRLRIFLLVSLITAGAVSFVGTIGFVGLVAPHFARMLVGEDQRFFIPLSAISGSLIMVFASIASKTIAPGAIIPIGIVTAVAGVPFLFFLILRKKRKEY